MSRLAGLASPNRRREPSSGLRAVRSAAATSGTAALSQGESGVGLRVLREEFSRSCMFLWRLSPTHMVAGELTLRQK